MGTVIWPLLVSLACFCIAASDSLLYRIFLTFDTVVFSGGCASEIVIAAVADWIGANEQPDDITLVLARQGWVRRRGQSGEKNLNSDLLESWV